MGRWQKNVPLLSMYDITMYQQLLSPRLSGASTPPKVSTAILAPALTNCSDY